ncbi:hypothetical protein [Streptomyces sp. NPDC002845]
MLRQYAVRVMTERQDSVSRSAGGPCAERDEPGAPAEPEQFTELSIRISGTDG